MTPPVAQANALSKRYAAGGRELTVLDGASLCIHSGQIVGLSGPSGVGKSTLLRLVAAIEPPDSGEVLLGGHAAWVRRYGRLRRRVPRPGFVMPVFQHPQASLDARWPVWRSIVEPLVAVRRARLPARRLREVAEEHLDRVGLGGVDPRARPAELSGGQCQRVAIARALVAEPALVVADEPTSALDVTTAADILHLLRAVADRGTALLVVSHNRDMLRVLADRTLRIAGGRVQLNEYDEESYP